MNYDNYDTLLGISNPELRKQMGVWYTPKEIVTYMVKGVDQILSTYFQLSLKSEDFVLLDPATGTGTFISEVIKYGKTTNVTAIEILEESYNIAKSKLPKTINLIHGNTLELNEEAIGANRVRQEQPVMVVLGNPPYNGDSKNNGTYITDLMNEYAMKGSNGALNDDYIKFIRYAQNLVDQNGSGVIAYISNNSFLSSVAMTNMRKSLLKSFDEIYVLNFTFDQKDTYEKVKDRIFGTVKTPVCIYFFVKTGLKAKGGLGDVYYKEFQGAKSDKFKYLNTTSVNKQDFKQINLLDPEYYFYPLDGDLKEEYTKNSFCLEKCFMVKGTGLLTSCDPLVLDTKQARLHNKIDAYFSKGELSGSSETVNERKTKHGVTKKEDGTFTTIPYRPFDTRDYFDSKLTEGRREEIRKHEKGDNQVFLAFKSVCWDKNAFSHVFITKKVGEYNFFAHGSTKYAPLYQYREATPLSPASQTTNFTTDFLNTLSTAISKSHQDDTTLATDQTFSSLDAMDYIYGVLNDKAYTTKYNQFLKSNYPRVPYPKSIATFIQYKDAGSKLRVIHLDDTTEDSKSTYNATTNNKIEKVTFSNNKLYFNKSSFFDNITQDMFDFKIGASQPLKNWLESRKGDSFDKPMLEQFLNVIYKVRSSL